MVVLGLVVCSVPACTPHRSQTAPAPVVTAPAVTALAALDEIGPTGSVTLSTAEQLFNATVDHLPGLPEPAQTHVAANPSGLTASFALDELSLFRSELSPAQVRVLDKWAPEVSPPSWYRQDSTTPVGVEAQVNDIRAWIAAPDHLNRQIAGPIVVVSDFNSKYTDSYAATTPITGTGPDGLLDYVGCRITLGPLWAKSGSALRLFTLAHEVFHCFQRAFSQDMRQFFRPAWVTEGEASWVAGQYLQDKGTRYTEPVPNGWETYLWGGTPLFRQTYSAVGFFDSLSASGIDVWQRLDPIFAQLLAVLPCRGDQCPVTFSDASALATADAAAFAEAIGDDNDALDELLPRQAIRPNLGDSWTLPEPDEEDIEADGASGHPLTDSELGVGQVFTVPQHLSGPTRISDVTVAAPIVTIDPTGFIGEIRLPDGTTENLSSMTGEQVICTTADCPADCPGIGAPTMAIGTDIYVAATTEYDLTLGASEDSPGQFPSILTGSDVCPKPPEQPPAPPGSGTGTSGSITPVTLPGIDCSDPCAYSFADPHEHTFDGETYDFQAAGEFTAAEDPDGGFTIQVRQQPLLRSQTVADVTAVAVSVGGHRVEVDPGGITMRVLIDGRNWSGSHTLVGTGAVDTFADDTGVEISWPDGSQAWITQFASTGLNLAVRAISGRAARLVGLLGNADGNRQDDVAPRGGAPLTAVSPATLYPAFANSWRISDRTSLFTYPHGASTATYTDPSFPRQQPDPATMPGAESARAICIAAGVTRQPFLNNCILDVAETGQPTYAQAELTAQGIATSSVSTVTLPDLRGEPQAQAMQTLTTLGLTARVHPVPGSSSAAGTVVCTQPAAGAQIASGSDVTLDVLEPGVGNIPSC